MINKLVNPSIVGVDMGFSKLPHPIRSSINWRCYYPLRPRTRSLRWQAKLYGNRFKCSTRGQEIDGASRICFAAIKGVDTVQKWKVCIVIVHYEQLIFIYGLRRIIGRIRKDRLAIDKGRIPYSSTVKVLIT